MISWIAAALFDWSIILCCTLVISYSWYILIPIAIIICGCRQHALAILVHDGAHKLISRRRLVNELLNWLCAAGPLGVDMTAYRKFHFAHHKHLGSALDPEIEAREYIDSLRALPTYQQAVRLFLFDCLGCGIKDFRRVVTFLSIKSLILWWCIFLMVVPTPLNLIIATIWFVSIPTSFWGCFRLRSMTEHVGINGTYLIRANWLERFIFLPHNTYLHAEHHLKPSIPFSGLPNVRTRRCMSVRQLWRHEESNKKDIL